MDNKDERPKYYKPLQHSMTRRRKQNDYRQGHRAYMITLTIEEDAKLLSELSGSPLQPVVSLTALGAALQEAWLALPGIYNHISLREDEFVVMPEHFHGILYTTQRSEEHLSDVLRAYKARLYRTYRRLLVEGIVPPVGLARDWLSQYQALTEPQKASMLEWLQKAEQRAREGSTGDIGKPPFSLGTTGKHNKTGFLFRVSYTDTWALDEEQLAEKCEYIRNNPAMRLLAQQNPSRMRLQRKSVRITNLTPAFVKSYLSRPDVAASYLRTLGFEEERTCKLDEVLSALLIAESEEVTCDSFGDLQLLQCTLLPVVCHRADKGAFALQKQRCLEAASCGDVLVSARISKGEQEIMDAAMNAGYPVVLIADNGYEDKQHPSTRHRLLCAEGKLLIVAPWHYKYGRKLNPLFSKAMNAVAQGLCHKKDSWWKG